MNNLKNRQQVLPLSLRTRCSSCQLLPICNNNAKFPTSESFQNTAMTQYDYSWTSRDPQDLSIYPPPPLYPRLAECMGVNDQI